MQVIEGGDLFSYLNSSTHSPTVSSMCHCVSVNLNMGAGIATLFKQRFGRVQELKDQKAQIGQVATLYLQEENMCIYLEAMKKHMLQHDVNELAIPLLGCGLDRLEWEKVQPIIVELFSDMPQFKIIVYKWEKGNDEIKKNSKKNIKKNVHNTE
nr:unnamed protein product [Naegleria fowleri]